MKNGTEAGAMRTLSERTEIMNQVAAATGIHLSRDVIADRSLDDLMAEAQRVAASKRKHSGRNALVRKLGKAGAEDYMQSKSRTGHRYNLNIR